MSILDILTGRPLANWEEQGEQIGPSAGIPIFGLDALSSAAYGPEVSLVSADVTKWLLSHQTRESAFEQVPEQARGIIRDSRLKHFHF